jgi:hypothetical protein
LRLKEPSRCVLSDRLRITRGVRDKLERSGLSETLGFTFLGLMRCLLNKSMVKLSMIPLLFFLKLSKPLLMLMKLSARQEKSG